MNQLKEFERNIKGTFGEQGIQWLEQLTLLVDKYAKRWELTDLKPVANLTYNYVLVGNKNGYPTPVVLKLGVPTVELWREMACLEYYNGVGVPRLLESDTLNGAMLLDRVMPGITLKTYFPQDEEASLAITARVIQQLQSVNISIEPHTFLSIEEWHVSLMNTQPSQTIPEEMLLKARALSNALISSQTTQVVLHADLHHDNVLLSKEEQWLAIDPKGIMGDPVYEVGAFIRNPVMDLRKQTNMQGILRRRVAAFAEYLSFEEQRIVQWSFVQAVLAACWSMEENNKSHAEYFIACAKLLQTL